LFRLKQPELPAKSFRDQDIDLFAVVVLHRAELVAEMGLTGDDKAISSRPSERFSRGTPDRQASEAQPIPVGHAHNREVI
jgi:hypothetical protein